MQEPIVGIKGHGVRPGTDAPTAVQLVHVSERTRITRLTLRRHTVVLKEPLGPDAEQRLRHELAMLERVRGVPGIAQLLDVQRYAGSIAMADAGSTTLSARTGGTARPDGAELARLAVALARTVSAMHSRSVIHLDIQPANIVLSAAGAPCLVDLALAQAVDGTATGATRHGDIVGTLAYLAPELTGRAGRPADQRADLYALGATLYELATGGPPFGVGDPLRLVHDHLARVPVPPIERNPALHRDLSEIILHLLEKEPGKRYQSADGLLHDLERLAEGSPDVGMTARRVGQNDVPLRLLPPRLVGRTRELATLEAAFEDALTGRCRAVLVEGAPGVGKTALIDALRPLVTRRGGWFVAGKFDQYRRDVEASAVFQAFRALARLLLAEPEDELTKVRDRIRSALGPNAGLMAAVVPDYSALLGVAPDPGDPATAQARGRQNGMEILRSVASPQRPLVYFADDVQWGGPTPLSFVDLLLDEEPVPGLLMICSYRERGADAVDPLSELLARWRGKAGVRHVQLGNLATPALVTMVTEMLRTDHATAMGLVEVMEPHTSGNPYDTVELLDGLRRDGILTATDSRWTWDPDVARLRLVGPETGRLLATAVAALPEGARGLVEAMSCLGGRTTFVALATATGEPAAVVGQLLAPAIREGVLVTESGGDDVVRFGHDRIQEAVLRGLDPQRRRDLTLAMARRLARVPELFVIAAEQYLRVADAIDDPAERQAVAALLRRAADHARRVAADEARVATLLTAALHLVDPHDTGTRVELHLARQRALYSLGRLDEADADYHAVNELQPTPGQRAEATAVQVRSLTNRNRFAEAVELGVTMLRELGLAVPVDRSPADVRRQIGHLHRWLELTDVDEELQRPELSDPTLLAATRLMASLVPVAYFVPDFPLFVWLTMEGPRIWLEHGPHPSVLGLTGVAANAARVLDQHHDYAVGYRALRRIIAVGEARGYEPETSLVRSTFASTACCWFEPIENAVRAAQQARQGLIAGGDLAWAGYAYLPSVAGLLDCAPTLDIYVAEVDAGVAFLRRSGNDQARQWLESYRWLADVLRGRAGDAVAAVHEALPVDLYAANPAALLYAHLARGVAAAMFDDAAGLAQHAEAAMKLLPTVNGLYSTAVAHLLHGLGLAERGRAADGGERTELLLRLDDVISWLAERVALAPDNVRHLLRLVEAERAWVVGDFRTAVLAFDAALREVDARVRPWHRALITERAARFHLAHGAEHMGRTLLASAREAYAAWGATAKVSQFDWAHPGLPGGSGAAASPGGRDDVPAPRRPVTTGTLDLLGVLAASQALSSETSIERLHARVVEVLSAMTGATGVRLLLWSNERQSWLATPEAGADGAGSGPEMPTSVLRYVQRIREPLVVEDATRDDRFARDPYFTGVDACSLLALPVLGRASLRGVLLLENRLIRGAFTTERLDAVKLVAGQLTVSLDNAQLYAELTASRARIVAAADHTRRRIERDLHDGAQQRLVALGMQARLAQAMLPPGAGDLDAVLERLTAEADQASEELRDLAQGIHPAVLAEGGLRPALGVLARRSTVPAYLRVHVGRLPDHVEIAAYFVIAESLTNAAKHARATEVRITVEASDDIVRIQVADDGRGGAEIGGGSGLLGLKDRVEALGGRFSVHSTPETGTTVRTDLPLTPPVAPE